MKCYELIGFWNMFGNIPDFVYPVFECSHKLYLQSGENDKIKEFVALKKSACRRIIYLKDINKIIGDISRRSLTVASKPIYAFQLKKQEVIYGDSIDMMKFFKDYPVEDDILREEIEDFQKEVRVQVCKVKVKRKALINGKYDVAAHDFVWTDAEMNRAKRALISASTKMLETHTRPINCKHMRIFGRKNRTVRLKLPWLNEN